MDNIQTQLQNQQQQDDTLRIRQEEAARFDQAQKANLSVAQDDSAVNTGAKGGLLTPIIVAIIVFCVVGFLVSVLKNR